VIFAWNEYFYALQVNFANGSTMPQWVITNVSTRGNFLAKLSAASIIACRTVVLRRLGGTEADDPRALDGRAQ
jgi:sorbitol/mannitol transport system permease protein